MEKNYVPQPVDISDVLLPEELDELVEKLAENIHEVWAQSRMEQGWTYGPERSDTLSIIRAWCRMVTFRRSRRHTTETLRSAS